MRYLVSDIHGCYEEYIELLQKIDFSDEDELFVLGDAMDRGPEPIKVIQDMMRRPNVFYILGNHDLIFLTMIQKLATEITENSLRNFDADTILNYQYWMEDGGDSTVKQFLQLSKAERMDILEYLEEAAPYEVLEEKNCLYILVHAGIKNFDPHKELDEYDPMDFFWERADYEKQYYPGSRIFLVTGHTPTPIIRKDKKPLVYCEKQHIALDCGCVYGGALATYCLETGQIVYVCKADK